ncbi:MAG: hypothetical protein VX738_05340 [Planctomycetota bacterium]|nr:hypothetical protein [Pseudomonadales bacterium]MEC7565090.1 hypothetical protein [Planctomycetota bacterium]
MPFEKNYDKQELDAITLPACIHLRNKAMCVTGQLEDTDHPDEAGSKNTWCNLTQHIIGPDKIEVNRARCVAGRECHCDS